MVNSSKNEIHYRVKFQNKGEKTPSEVTVQHVSSSEIMGCIVLEDFVFIDQKKHVILPTEDDARKRYKDVKKLHIPYMSIIAVEEVEAVETDLSSLPFLKKTSPLITKEQI